jgi:predicted dienelactone hydrolase
MKNNLPARVALKRIIILSLLNFLLMPGLAQAQTQQVITFESRTCISVVKINDQCDPVIIGAILYLPKDKTNTLITISHGSGGLDERHFAYAKQINSLGFAALVIDHWTPRGVAKTHLNYLAATIKGGAPIQSGSGCT